MRPGMRSAISLHFMTPSSMHLRIISSSCFVHGPLTRPGSSTLRQRWWHCASVRPLPMRSAILPKSRTPMSWMHTRSLSSSSLVQRPPPAAFLEPRLDFFGLSFPPALPGLLPIEESCENRPSMSRSPLTSPELALVFAANLAAKARWLLARRSCTATSPTDETKLESCAARTHTGVARLFMRLFPAPAAPLRGASMGMSPMKMLRLLMVAVVVVVPALAC
mmetsp:Transcript_32178/g.102361  ORF Transcript_32178/g.102361 Transcript_32178/m.102361 type:complete len:221 (-) Transcript_32178:286-948(-)